MHHQILESRARFELWRSLVAKPPHVIGEIRHPTDFTSGATDTVAQRIGPSMWRWSRCEPVVRSRLHRLSSPVFDHGVACAHPPSPPTLRQKIRCRGTNAGLAELQLDIGPWTMAAACAENILVESAVAIAPRPQPQQLDCHTALPPWNLRISLCTRPLRWATRLQ